MCMLIVARAYECSACRGPKRGSFLGFQAVVTLWELNWVLGESRECSQLLTKLPSPEL